VHVPLTTPATERISSPASASPSVRHDRDCTGYGAFETQRRAARSRQGLQSRAVLAEQILICRDDVTSALERALDQLSGIRRSADNLDNEIDVRIVDDGASIACEETALEHARTPL